MSGQSFVHGLGSSARPADWPAPSEAELAEVLGHYRHISGNQRVLWTSPRPFSAAVRVETGDGVVFVKRHSTRIRTQSDLRAEHRFMAHLGAAGLPVAEPLQMGDGDTVWATRDWVYEVHRDASDGDVYREAQSWTPFQMASHARAAGEALALLHRAAKGFEAPPRQARMLLANLRLFGVADPLAAVAADLAQHPALAAFLEPKGWRRAVDEMVVAPFHATFRRLLRDEPPSWTHGDWHPSNLLWSGEGQVARVLDFGLSDRNFALFDVATAIERSAISWLAADTGGTPVADLDQIDRFLDGYASILPFGAGAMEKLAALLPIVHADFAYGEIAYYVEVLGSVPDAMIAYERYLLGHAAWFSGNEGQTLLSHLVRR